MKYLIHLCIFIFLIANVSAVQNVFFNYEFNNSQSIVYSNIVKDDSIVLNVQTDLNSLYCKYSKNAGYTFESMEGTFDFSFQQLNKKSFSYLSEGVYKLYVKCRDGNGSLGQESELIFSIINPVKAEIYLNKESPVNSGLLEITLKTSKQLSQKPTLSYSSDGSRYETIPLSGSNDLWEGYIIISNELKESVGSFKFRGIDLDGIAGEEITKGEIFLIDTVRPSLITQIESEGRERDIYLQWRFEGDYSKFNIYRSKFANVEYTDFYKSVDKKSFTDSDVEVGRAYYYRVTTVDSAGNEGDLSYEVYSVAIKNAINSSNDITTGLDSELMGSVDSLLYDLDAFYKQINEIKTDFESDDSNKDLISKLGLMSEIDSSKKELENLEDEVTGYKEQKLTRVELDKKISNARTKLLVIKKKLPESLSIISQTEFDKKYDLNKINEILLSVGKGEDEIKEVIKKSKYLMDKNGFEYKTSIKNVEIYYSDGSKIIKAIVIKDISFENENNGSFIEFIPKDIANSVSEINFRDNSYDVIKDDSVVSFSSNTKQIAYILNKEVDLILAKNIETFFLIEENEVDSQNSITGFAILENNINSNSFIILIILIIIGFLVFYFFKSKKDNADLEILNDISDKLSEAKLYIETKNEYKLNEIYSELNEFYKKLSDKSKETVYNKIINFSKQIKAIKQKR